MLVLSRKPKEVLRIRDDIVVTVLAICGNKVRLGIEAPVRIPVDRSELLPSLSGTRTNAGSKGIDAD